MDRHDFYEKILHLHCPRTRNKKIENNWNDDVDKEYWASTGEQEQLRDSSPKLNGRTSAATKSGFPSTCSYLRSPGLRMPAGTACLLREGRDAVPAYPRREGRDALPANCRPISDRFPYSPLEPAAAEDLRPPSVCRPERPAETARRPSCACVVVGEKNSQQEQDEPVLFMQSNNA